MPSPRKTTTDNGTKSKGTMREAYPSLPFGSPTLDNTSSNYRDTSRTGTTTDKTISDRTVDTTVIAGSSQLSSGNTNISSATISREDGAIRTIDKDSNVSAACNTDGKYALFFNFD